MKRPPVAMLSTVFLAVVAMPAVAAIRPERVKAGPTSYVLVIDTTSGRKLVQEVTTLPRRFDEHLASGEGGKLMFRMNTEGIGLALWRRIRMGEAIQADPIEMVDLQALAASGTLQAADDTFTTAAWGQGRQVIADGKGGQCVSTWSTAYFAPSRGDVQCRGAARDCNVLKCTAPAP